MAAATFLCRVSEHCLSRQCWSDLWTMASLGNYKWAGRGCNTAPSVWGILSQQPALGLLAHHCVCAHHQHNSKHSSSTPSYQPPPDLCAACGLAMKTDFCVVFFSRHSSASWNACQQRNSGLSPYRSCGGLPPGGAVYREVNCALYMATPFHSQEDSATNLGALAPWRGLLSAMSGGRRKR